MKYFTKTTLMLACITASASIFAAPNVAPWNDKNQKAFLLPDKDKTSLNSILSAGLNALNKSTITAETYNKAMSQFNTSVDALNKQVDGIKLSLSGILSKLTWQERLTALEASARYILDQINSVPTNTRDRDSTNQINNALSPSSGLILRIQAKARS